MPDLNVTVAEISRRLSSQVENVCLKLLPNGKRHGEMWLAGDVSGEAGKSLQVHLGGQYIGHWKDFANDDDRGDLLDLWERSQGLSRVEAIRAAKQYLGLEPLSTVSQQHWDRPNNPAVKDINPNGKAMKYLCGERRLDATTVLKFKVKGDGTNIVFPCYGPGGEWMNSSYRSIRPGPDGKKQVFQDTGCAPCLFGWHALPESIWKDGKILICEGQIDAMTWDQWGIRSLSIPNGGGRTWIEYEWDNLSAFDTIFLAFDTDGKSDSNLSQTIERLGRHRCRIVKLPFKDANDALQGGATASDARKWVEDAKFPDMATLVSADSLYHRIMAEFHPAREAEGIVMEEFRVPNRAVKFPFRPGELTVWGGESFAGKSTFLGWLFGRLAAVHCQKCGIWSMEVKPEKTLKKIILSLAPDIENSERLKMWQSNIAPRFVAYDRIGYIEEEELIETMAYAAARYGVRHAMIDSLMRITGLEENYPAQGKIMNRLAELARRTGMHIHLVAHTRKMAADSHPTANDIKGSSLIRNNCDNMLIAVRNMKKALRMRDAHFDTEDTSESDLTLFLEKDRETGEYARFDFLFNRRDNTYSQFIPAPPAPPKEKKKKTGSASEPALPLDE